MRRLARRLFTLCSAASLLLCVAVFALWVRGSRGTTDLLTCRDPTGTVTMVASTTAGRLTVRRVGDWPRPEPLRWSAAAGPGNKVAREPELVFGTTDPDGPPGLGVTPWHGPLNTRGFRGVACTPLPDGSYSAAMPAWGASVPKWLAAAPTLAPPAAWAVACVRPAATRRRRSRRGLCPSCCYDLRASPGRCPKCGAQAAAGA